MKWTSATWRGVTVAAMVSPGGVAGASGSGLVYAGAVGYADGPLSAAVGYQHANGFNGAGPAQAVIGSYNVDAGTNSQLLAIVGIRHRF